MTAIDAEVAQQIDLERQVRHLQWQLDQAEAQIRTERRLTENVTRRYQRARANWQQVAADEINRATAEYVERIRDQQAYIAFLERERP